LYPDFQDYVRLSGIAVVRGKCGRANPQKSGPLIPLPKKAGEPVGITLVEMASSFLLSNSGTVGQQELVCK